MDCLVRGQTLNCSIVEKVCLIYVWQVVFELEFLVKCISLLVILKLTCARCWVLCVCLIGFTVKFYFALVMCLHLGN